MKRAFVAVLLVSLGLGGCTNVSTTNGGVLGVDREQFMFDALSSREMNLSYAQSYKSYVLKAAEKGQLATDTPQGKHLQEIAVRLVVQAPVFKPAASKFGWHISLIRSNEMNANCGPGGKIIVYTGLLDRLKLTDDEIAAVLGHEIAHALREHSREQASSSAAFELVGTLGASALGAGSLGKTAITQVLKTGVGLPFSRRDETEADLMGLELAARAGFDPRAAITLWKKMDTLGDSSMMPAFLRTHPTNEDRILVLREAIPKVMPLYVAADKQ